LTGRHPFWSLSPRKEPMYKRFHVLFHHPDGRSAS
jgi:hypothetical protein